MKSKQLVLVAIVKQGNVGISDAIDAERSPLKLPRDMVRVTFDEKGGLGILPTSDEFFSSR